MRICASTDLSRIRSARYLPSISSDWNQTIGWLKHMCHAIVTGGNDVDIMSRKADSFNSSFRCSIHRVALQDAIVEAFSDSLSTTLIENNRRRIEILEEMARLLYREWFVHFRFPGHEDVELVDSDLGPISEGWAWTTPASMWHEVKIERVNIKPFE